MPRTKLGAAEYAISDFQREIRVKMAYYDLDQKNLARKAGIDPCTLSRRLKDPKKITLAELESLHRVLHLDLAMILPMFGAARKDLKA